MNEKNKTKKITKVAKEEEKVSITLERPCTPLQSLEQSLKEVKLMREGKLRKKTIEEMFAEIEQEKEENEE